MSSNYIHGTSFTEELHQLEELDINRIMKRTDGVVEELDHQVSTNEELISPVSFIDNLSMQIDRTINAKLLLKEALEEKASEEIDIKKRKIELIPKIAQQMREDATNSAKLFKEKGIVPQESFGFIERVIEDTENKKIHLLRRKRTLFMFTENKIGVWKVLPLDRRICVDSVFEKDSGGYRDIHETLIEGVAMLENGDLWKYSGKQGYPYGHINYPNAPSTYMPKSWHKATDEDLVQLDSININNDIDEQIPVRKLRHSLTEIV